MGLLPLCCPTYLDNDLPNLVMDAKQCAEEAAPACSHGSTNLVIPCMVMDRLDELRYARLMDGAFADWALEPGLMFYWGGS